MVPAIIINESFFSHTDWLHISLSPTYSCIDTSADAEEVEVINNYVIYKSLLNEYWSLFAGQCEVFPDSRSINCSGKCGVL